MQFSCRQAKENVYSRAYLVFNNTSTLNEFMRSYHGHGFQDSKGNQYHAIVELAPFQKYIPSDKRRRIDVRFNTIEDDEMYKAFLESLSNAPTVEEEPVIQTPTTTPLVEALKLAREKKKAQKVKKEISNLQKSISGIKQMSLSQSSQRAEPKAETSNDGKKKKRNRKKKEDASREGTSKDGRSRDGREKSDTSKTGSKDNSKPGRVQLILQRKDGVITTFGNS
jgi:regulator of nonsense transcripts 3